MRKVIVIGCPGSGKTTFSERLRDRSGLPLYHLDAIWHKPDRSHISRDEFDARLEEVLSGDRWIIDGHYSRTLERRIAACDTVCFFDLPVEDCLSGVLARLGKARPDVPWIDTAPDPRFQAEVEMFPSQQLPVIRELLSRYREGRTVVTFQSREAADRWLCETFPK